MNINRHNYEEYFILYMDNELGSDERRMVEAFVLQHPDLKEELDLLLQYKLVPDTSVVYTAKEDLMKINGDAPVTLTNYEEWFVLYTDNELTTQQKIAVESFISHNPLLKKELALLQRTRLTPETVVFENKADLYRKEEKVRPVRWWRMAAAAVLLLAVGITAVLVINRKNNQVDTGIAKGTNEKKTTPSNPVVTPQAPVTNNESELVKTSKEKITIPAIKENIQRKDAVVKQDNKINKFTPQVTKQPQPFPVQQEPKQAIANNNVKKSNELPQPDNNPYVNKKEQDSPLTAYNQNNGQQKNALTNTTVTPRDPQPLNVQHAASVTSDADTFEQPDEEKKNKSRGLFRKIARTLEKRTSVEATDDNKLLIAGLAIRLK